MSQQQWGAFLRPPSFFTLWEQGSFLSAILLKTRSVLVCIEKESTTTYAVNKLQPLRSLRSLLPNTSKLPFS